MCFAKQTLNHLFEEHYSRYIFQIMSRLYKFFPFGSQDVPVSLGAVLGSNPVTHSGGLYDLAARQLGVL